MAQKFLNICTIFIYRWERNDKKTIRHMLYDKGIEPKTHHQAMHPKETAASDKTVSPEHRKSNLLRRD